MQSHIKDLLSNSLISKDKFIFQYSKIRRKHETKEVYLFVLSEIKKAVLENNFSKFKKISEVIEYITVLEIQEVLKKYYKSNDNPLKNTNVVILACKHNSNKILKYILSSSNLLCNLSIDIGYDAIVPDDTDDECHNSFYYAIRSNNVELLETLISKWPNKYFDINMSRLDEILSSAYEELKLKKVSLSKGIEIYVENKLLSLRFFSDTSQQTEIGTNLNTITERIKLVIEEIKSITEHFLNFKEIDEIFLQMSKFIAQNIHILKRQLKSTYNKLPWEEVEFLLCVFVLSHTKHQEINLFNHAVLKVEKIICHLEKFAKMLFETNLFDVAAVSKLSILPSLKRDNVVEEIINTDRELKELYEDYQQIRDIHSLYKVSNYINLALSASPKEKGQLIIIRVIQVTGEYLKNTLESPKLSSATSELILLSLPKNTREIITDLRNSLSHVYSLSKRFDMETNMDIEFFVGIQNDMKKIGNVISDVLVSRKIKMIKILLENVINCKNIDEIKCIAKIVSCVELDEMTEESFEITELKRLKKLLANVSAIISDKTHYEQQLFDKIDIIISSKNITKEKNAEDYIFGLQLLRSLSKCDNSTITGAKFYAQVSLQNINSQIESHNLKEIAELSRKICNSVTPRMEDNVDEVWRLTLEIFNIAEYGMNDVKWIEELRQMLKEKESFISTLKHETCSLTEGTCSKQLKWKISELKSIIDKNELSNSAENIFLCTTNAKLLSALETLLLDIMSILGVSKMYSLEDNILLLEENSPLLTGKCLRNHLAHYNILAELLSDSKIAVILNAMKLTSETIECGRTFGKSLRDNPTKLKQKHKRDLAVIVNQKNMFIALEEGNIETLKKCLRAGADLNARSINLSTALHFACKGPSLDVVKFVLERNPNFDVKNVSGQNPLHVAAANGRRDIVLFFIKEMGMNLKEVEQLRKTPLHLAAQNGHKDTVDILLQNKADHNTHDISGRSPLHYAVRNDHLDVAKLLLKKDLNVDYNETMEGFTSLHEAADSGILNLVNFLLQEGANVNIGSDRGWMPLHAAAMNGYVDVAIALISKGAEVNAAVMYGCTPLHFAAEYGHERIVDILLKHEANVNAVNKSGCNTPLHYAAKYGFKGIVKNLLKNKANVNVFTINGMTPLLLAAESGHLEIVTILLKFNPNVNARNINNFTALHLAAKNNYVEIVDVLVKSGALVDVKDISGFSPMHEAALRNYIDVFKLLMKYTEIDVKTAKGSTLLHIAVGANSRSVIDFLLKSKVNMNAQDNVGHTALHLAAANGHKDVTFLLIENNADIDSKNFLFMTPLHVASYGGYTDVMNLLIDNKAQVNAKACKGYTPLHFAVLAGHKEAVRELILKGADIEIYDNNHEVPLFSAVKINNKDIVHILLSNRVTSGDECRQALSLAVFAGYKDIVLILLKYQPLVNMKDQNVTLLHIAAKRGHKEIVNILILNGADCNARTINDETPLFIAAQEGHDRIVEILIANKGTINTKSKEGVTPLHISSTFGHNKVVNVLLSNGANPNVKDKKNRTAVEVAVAYSHLNVVKSLVQYKVDINAKGNDDWTLLHIASQKNNLEIIMYLVDEGCGIHTKNLSGAKPIHIAAEKGLKDVVKFFLNEGCSINDFGTANQTLLHYAAKNGQLEIVKYLIIEGADVNSEDYNAVTPMYLASNFGYKDVVEVLLNNGAYYTDKTNRKSSEIAKNENVIKLLKATENLFKAVKQNSLSDTKNCIQMGAVLNGKNSESGTPLHLAAYKGYFEIVQILLKYKSNPNAVSKGSTPLHYAAKFSHLRIVKELLSNGAVYDAVSYSGKTPQEFAVDKNVISLLLYVSDVFEKIKNNNSKVIEDLNKKDIHTVKAVLNARNRDNQTLVVFALLKNFSRVEELKSILQGNVSSEVDKGLKFLHQNNYSRALYIFNSILEKRKDILGPDNPGTLDIQMYLAKALYKKGLYEEAVIMLDEIFKKLKDMLGLNNKYTLSVRSFFAFISSRLGKEEESLAIHQEVYQKQLDLLGSNDSDTIKTQLHMASILDSLGKHDEALRNNQQAYKRMKEIQHPGVLQAQNNIAMVLANQGKYDEALKIYEEVLLKKKMVFGVDHADTLRTLHNIAIMLFKQKKYPEALESFRELLKSQINAIGPINPDTLNTQYNMANVLFTQGKWVAAFKAFKENLEFRKSVFGPNHPTVINILRKVKMINFRFKMDGNSESEIIRYLQKDIIIASNDGDFQTVKYLLKNGSDVNERDIEGRTPLHFAVTNGHINVVHILLKHGADVTQITNKGNTPLHTATSKGNEEIIRILLENVSGKKLDDLLNAVTTSDKNTSLHVAAKNASSSIILYLLEHGAVYNIKNNKKKIPAELSIDYHVSNILKLLEELFRDAKVGNIKMVDKLKVSKPEEISAFTNARNNQGKTLLQVLICNQHQNIASQLLQVIKNC